MERERGEVAVRDQEPVVGQEALRGESQGGARARRAAPGLGPGHQRSQRRAAALEEPLELAQPAGRERVGDEGARHVVAHARGE